MKKIILLILSFFLFTGCPVNKLPGCELSVSFNCSQNPEPLYVTVEIENKTSTNKNIYLENHMSHFQYAGYANFLTLFHSGYKLEDKYNSEGYERYKEVTVESGKSIKFEHLSFMTKFYSKMMYRVLTTGISYPSEEDGKTLYPCEVYLGVAEVSDDINSYFSSYSSSNILKYRVTDPSDIYKLTVEDFEKIGGDFFYIQDPAKSGTDKFGHLVCPSDPTINGLESGHVKIKFIITDDPDTGKINVEFKSLGIVTEEEQ